MLKPIVITGITGCRNRGVEALLRTTLEGLSCVRPHTPLTVWTDTPDFDSSVCGREGIAWVDQRSVVREVALKHSAWLGRTLMCLPRVAKGYKRLRLSIRSAGLVISSGGDIFGKDYGVYSMRKYIEPLQWAKAAGVPYVFLAQSIGPFSDPERRNLWLSVGRYASLITVRERVTYQYLTQELGLPIDKVQLTADPAFLLPSRGEVGLRLRTAYAPPGDGPLLAVSVSQGIAKYAALNIDGHSQAWLIVLRALRQRFNAKIILIPHVQELRYDNDDRIMCTQLWRDLGYPEWLRVAGGAHTASEYKSLLSECDAVLAERMHAAIGALSSCVPTLVVGYSPKGIGIISDLFGEGVLRDATLLPVDRFHSDPLALFRSFEALWAQRYVLRHKLDQQIPRMCELANSNFSRLGEFRS